MTWILNQGKGHAVHLDNLFTSSKLLTILQEYGVRAASTIWTGQTWREVNNEKTQMREQSLLQPAQEEDQEEDKDEDVDLDLDQDVHGFNNPNI